MGRNPDSQCPYCYQSIHYHAPNCHGQRIVKEIMAAIPLQECRQRYPTEREKDWAELEYLRGEVARLREKESELLRALEAKDAIVEMAHQNTRTLSQDRDHWVEYSQKETARLGRLVTDVSEAARRVLPFLREIQKQENINLFLQAKAHADHIARALGEGGR